MCIFSGDVRINKPTIGLGYQHRLKPNKHGCLYSNEVDNLTDGANSMILQFPAKDGEIQFLDSTNYAFIIEEIKAYHTESDNLRSGGKPKSVLNKIQTVGAYTLSLCDAKNLLKMYKKLDIPHNKEQITFLAEKNPDFTNLVCKWTGKSVATTQPIWVEYTPIYKDWLHFPMLDAHDGEKPQDVPTKTNHLLGFYHPNMFKYPSVEEKRMRLSKPVPFIGQQIFTTNFLEDSVADNGDMWIKTVPDLNDAFFGDNDLSFKQFNTPQAVLNSIL